MKDVYHYDITKLHKRAVQKDGLQRFHYGTRGVAGLNAKVLHYSGKAAVQRRDKAQKNNCKRYSLGS